ncbi:hypothetical protein K1T71_004524 [Dendrolimus kikuchii]|uniref:Uncharacterized protein n=1 Tax=Dendrolimus kikuchii TaxID=765133 RepID=A0ACC1D7P1_9NEOP|nr:hypothetical protein K1T71_004524 [Dendrolimus kikuchii]
MIKITKYILLVIILLSPTSSSDVTYEGPSKITVNENFKEPTALPPGYPGVPTAVNNFVHQGTNFFFNPKFLLGVQVPPPIGAIIASINPDYDKITGNLIGENIKVPIGGNKTLLVGVTEDLRKPNEVTITGNYGPLPTTVKSITEPTVKMNNIVPVEPIVQDHAEEVIELHDILTISEKLQPVLRPKLIVTQELLTIPEAPVLPPLVIPELPVKVTVEESIPLSIELPSTSETDLYIPINLPNGPLLIKSNEYRPLITEIDYKLNEIPTAPELPRLLLNKFP